MAKDSLEGRRVFLREFAPGDAAALFEAVHASRERLRRRLDWVKGVASVEDEARFIELSSRDEHRRVWGVFEIKDSGLLGTASLSGLEPAARARAKISMWIRGDRRDKGFATEAGRLVLEHGFKRLSLHRVFARVDPGNRAYRRVMKKLAFRYEGCLRSDTRLNGRWIDQECWGLLRSEWKK